MSAASSGRELRGVALNGGIADAAERLHNPLGPDPLHGMDRIDHPQERDAPRGNADHVAFAQRRLEIVSGRGADRRQDRFFAILVAFGDNRLVNAIALPQRPL